MRLLDTLERLLATEQSLFRAQLLREDIARLKKLQALAASAPDLASFKKSGARVGWTQGDLRTHELSAPLDAFLESVYAYQTGSAAPEQETRIEAAWDDFQRTRMERLIGCLANPVPKPDD